MALCFLQGITISFHAQNTHPKVILWTNLVGDGGRSPNTLKSLQNCLCVCAHTCFFFFEREKTHNFHQIFKLSISQKTVRNTIQFSLGSFVPPAGGTSRIYPACCFLGAWKRALHKTGIWLLNSTESSQPGCWHLPSGKGRVLKRKEKTKNRKQTLTSSNVKILSQPT